MAASHLRTEDEARANLVDALTEFLLSCFERQTLDTVLREVGFTPGPPPPTSTESPDVDEETEVLSVPLPFVLQAAHDDPHDAR